jgi:hypothetical protein
MHNVLLATQPIVDLAPLPLRLMPHRQHALHVQVIMLSVSPAIPPTVNLVQLVTLWMDLRRLAYLAPVFILNAFLVMQSVAFSAQLGIFCSQEHAKPVAHILQFNVLIVLRPNVPIAKLAT